MLEIKLVNRGDTGELILTGRLDGKTAPEAQKIFEQVSDRFPNIIINMSGLQYITSMGLRVLKLLYLKINKADGTLVLTNVAPLVMEVIEMTGFSTFLKIV